MKIRYDLPKHFLVRYGISICIPIAALLSYQVLVKVVGGDLPTYITFYPAVMITALLAGVGPGVVATATAALLAGYWLLPPQGQFAILFFPDAVGIALFSFNCVLVSVIAELYRRARQRAADYAAELVLRDERKKVEEALRESERRYRELVENANSVIIRWKSDGAMTFVNEYAQTFFGYNEDDLIGKHVNILVPEYDSTGDDLTGLIQDIVDHPEGYVQNVNENVRRDGSRVWMAWTNKPILDENGKVTEILAVATDITERKRAEQALEERTAKLEEINKELESFSYSVSHDLRAPLRAIDGYARLILKKQGDKFDADTTRKFTDIRLNARMMGKLIDDLLTFSRLGRKHISLRPLDMEVLVKDAWKELQASDPERNIKFTVQSMPPGYGDMALVKQVLINVLSNAVKFTKYKDVAEIVAGGYADENEMVYYVRDNGAGFDMTYYDKLFGVFQRLHGTEQFEGTGVGLATTQRIIHRHGGRVWGEGKVDEGATFYFSLPSSHTQDDAVS